MPSREGKVAMSNETTNPVVKWILIGICVVSLCVVGAFVLLGTYPAGEYRVAGKLQKRGFEVKYVRQGNNIWQYSISVIGSDLSVTEDDCQLICQLPRLQYLVFQRCDLLGLNLDDIGNCQELMNFYCEDVTQLSVDEVRKLSACPVHMFIFRNAGLNDPDLEDFAKWTKLGYVDLENNTGITDAGFEHLEKITSLRYLGLAGTSVSKESAEEFQKKHPAVRVQLSPLR